MSSPTRVLPPSPGGLPSFYSLSDLIMSLYGEAEILNLKLMSSQDSRILLKLIYTNNLIEYWEDVYLTLYGEPFRKKFFE